MRICQLKKFLLRNLGLIKMKQTVQRHNQKSIKINNF